MRSRDMWAVSMAVVLAAAAQDAGELYQQGTRLFSEGHSAGAIEALERSVKARPDFAAAWKALGVVYAAGGNYERAEPPFGKACELDPALADACLYHGRTLYLLNRFQAAVGVLRKAIERDKSNSHLYRILGMALEGSGQVEEAGPALEQAVRLYRGSAPNDDPGIDYGVYLFRQGRVEKALAPLEAALARHPDAARAHMELGCVQLSLDRLAEAEKSLERAVALDPRTARAHLLLGKVYQRLGKTEAAAEQLKIGAGGGR